MSKWFLAGCIMLIITGCAHLAVMLGPQPQPKAGDETTLLNLVNTLEFELPLAKRTLGQIDQGFHLFFSIALITMGISGLTVRAAPNSTAAVKRLAAVFALGGTVMLINSIIHWFVIPTSLIGVSTLLLAVSFTRDGKQVQSASEAQS